MQKTLVSNFLVNGEVVPQQRPRASVVAGHARVHDVPKCTQFRSYVRIITAHAYEGDLDNESCFEVYLTFGLAIPKSTSKKRQNMMAWGEILPTKKPDLDNAAKGVLDAMSGIIWKDDSQIVKLVLNKKYSAMPSTEVTVYRLDQE